MIYQSPNSTYLFLYDAVDDRPCIVDVQFDTLEEAEWLCQRNYNVNKDMWIRISDPLPDCQCDFITPKKIQGWQAGYHRWGEFQLVNDTWRYICTSDKYVSFEGMSENGCLSVAGLFDEFDRSKRHDPANALKIVINLGLSMNLLYRSIGEPAAKSSET